ncbi:5592_t:CDS:1, partial [Racocetra fulgida]
WTLLILRVIILDSFDFPGSGLLVVDSFSSPSDSFGLLILLLVDSFDSPGDSFGLLIFLVVILCTLNSPSSDSLNSFDSLGGDFLDSLDSL